MLDFFYLFSSHLGNSMECTTVTLTNTPQFYCEGISSAYRKTQPNNLLNSPRMLGPKDFLPELRTKIYPRVLFEE